MPYRLVEFFFDWWERRREKRRAELGDPRIRNDQTYDDAIELIEKYQRDLDSAHRRINELEGLVDQSRSNVIRRIEEAEQHFEKKWQRIEADYAQCHEDRISGLQLIAQLKEQVVLLTSQVHIVNKRLNETAGKVEATAEKVNKTAETVEAMKDSGASGTSLH